MRAFLVKEVLQKFERGKNTADAVDIGIERSDTWPRSWDELTEDQKGEALVNYQSKYEHDWDFNTRIVISDEFLMEPAHDLLQQRLGKDPYRGTKVPGGPIIGFDPEAIEFDINRREINIRGALQINDWDAFYQYLGLSEHLWNRVYTNFYKDEISIEEDSYDDYEFTEDDEKEIANAEKEFKKYLWDRFEEIKDAYYYFETDEFYIEEIQSKEVKFTKDLEPTHIY